MSAREDQLALNESSLRAKKGSLRVRCLYMLNNSSQTSAQHPHCGPIQTLPLLLP